MFYEKVLSLFGLHLDLFYSQAFKSFTSLVDTCVTFQKFISNTESLRSFFYVITKYLSLTNLKNSIKNFHMNLKFLNKEKFLICKNVCINSAKVLNIFPQSKTLIFSEFSISMFLNRIKEFIYLKYFLKLAGCLKQTILFLKKDIFFFLTFSLLQIRRKFLRKTFYVLHQHQFSHL